jgi:hypothetical protein
MDINALRDTLQKGKDFLNSINLHEDILPNGSRKISIGKALANPVVVPGIGLSFEGAGAYVIAKTTGLSEILAEGAESVGNSLPASPGSTT